MNTSVNYNYIIPYHHKRSLTLQIFWQMKILTGNHWISQGLTPTTTCESQRLTTLNTYQHHCMNVSPSAGCWGSAASYQWSWSPPFRKQRSVTVPSVFHIFLQEDQKYLTNRIKTFGLDQVSLSCGPSHLVSSPHMSSQLHFGEVSFPNGFQQSVVPNVRRLVGGGWSVFRATAAGRHLTTPIIHWGMLGK